MVTLEQCRIVHSRRRSCSVEVRDGAVILRLPLGSGLRAAERLLDRYGDWAERKLELQRREAIAPVRVEFGGFFPLFERCYELKPGVRAGFDGAFYLKPEDDEQLADKLRLLYRRLAADILKKKLDRLSNETGLEYAGMRISGAVRRWGSCSVRRTISLVWRLLLLPEDLCDYVICHELAHTRVLNHSADFYAVLDGICPGRRELEARLRARCAVPDNWI